MFTTSREYFSQHQTLKYLFWLLCGLIGLVVTLVIFT